MTELKISDYGRFHFLVRHKKYEPIGLDLVAEIVSADKKYFLLRDNDEIEYYVLKTDIKSFTRMDKPKEL